MPKHLDLSGYEPIPLDPEYHQSRYKEDVCTRIRILVDRWCWSYDCEIDPDIVERALSSKPNSKSSDYVKTALLQSGPIRRIGKKESFLLDSGDRLASRWVRESMTAILYKELSYRMSEWKIRRMQEMSPFLDRFKFQWIDGDRDKGQILVPIS